MKRLFKVLIVLFLWLFLGSSTTFAQETSDQDEPSQQETTSDPSEDDINLQVQQQQQPQKSVAETYVELTEFEPGDKASAQPLDKEELSIPFTINKVDQDGNPVKGAEFEIYYEEQLLQASRYYHLQYLSEKGAPYSVVYRGPAPEYWVIDLSGYGGWATQYYGSDSNDNMNHRYLVLTEQLYYKDGTPKTGDPNESLLVDDFDFNLSEWKVYNIDILDETRKKNKEYRDLAEHYYNIGETELSKQAMAQYIQLEKDIYAFESVLMGDNRTVVIDGTNPLTYATDEELVEYKQRLLSNYVGNAKYLGLERFGFMANNMYFSLPKKIGTFVTDENGQATALINNYYLTTKLFQEGVRYTIADNGYSGDNSTAYIYKPLELTNLKIVEVKVPDGYKADTLEYTVDLNDGTITIINYKEPTIVPTKEEKKEQKKEQEQSLKEETKQKIEVQKNSTIQTSFGFGVMGYMSLALSSLAALFVSKKQ